MMQSYLLFGTEKVNTWLKQVKEGLK